jgi:hypothetical protein
MDAQSSDKWWGNELAYISGLLDSTIFSGHCVFDSSSTSTRLWTLMQMSFHYRSNSRCNNLPRQMTPFPKEEKNWPDVTVSFVIAIVTGTSAMDRG